ncbi:MAG TPA: lamin tail domain-containing protein, partial [Ilumatobacteraceae bacterium]|nr:lamin tail domain-containing protein [Ilumatobacteraceae bacterium]
GTTITASYNSASATARINVIEPPTGLVINEIDYDQPGTDMDEFVEIYNGTGAAVDFTNLAIAFVNGSSAASNQPNLQYMQASLAGVGMLPAGSYLLVTKQGLVTDPGLNCAGPGVGTTCILFTPTVFADNPSNPPNQPPTKPTAWPGSGIQNGDPDGVLLLNTSTGRVIDRLSYGGPMTTCKVTNIGGEISLVEGTALDPTVRDVVTGSLGRNELGRDTNDANTDWKFSATPSPGKANPAFQ